MVLLKAIHNLLLLGIALFAFVGLYALVTPGVPYEGAGLMVLLLMGPYYLVGRYR